MVHGARNSWDLGYRAELESLNHECGKFVYVPTVTRPEAREAWSGHVGRVNTVFLDGTVKVDSQRDHVFLCGSPEMAEEMQRYFSGLGYEPHSVQAPGNLHIERYW